MTTPGRLPRNLQPYHPKPATNSRTASKKPRQPRGHNKVVGLETLAALTARLQINAWDFLAIGDGSGTGWDAFCGWSCVSVERVTGERRHWYGACNSASISFAETMPYLVFLTWLANRVYSDKVRRVVHVHLISDSQYVQGMVERPESGKVKNAVLWEQMAAFARLGIIVKCHWAERNTVELNRYADAASRLVRQRLQSYDLSGELAAAGWPAGPQQFNPGSVDKDDAP